MSRERIRAENKKVARRVRHLEQHGVLTSLQSKFAIAFARKRRKDLAATEAGYKGNPAAAGYQGEFGLHGRYQTYGQHSFIYDLIAAAHRRGVRVTLLVEGLSTFPLAEPLKKYARVFEMDTAPSLGPTDLILVDEPTDKLVMSLPAGCPTVCVIHKKTAAYSQTVQDRCDQFLYMTEAALEYQSRPVN